MSLTELLRLTSAPVAIAFVDTAPPGVAHVAATEPAGCGYWRRAAAGEVFFTVADDHKRCPIGAHTHNVPFLSEAEQERAHGAGADDGGVVVPEDGRRGGDSPPARLRCRSRSIRRLAVAPLPPDVVLVRGNARQLMLLSEAAQAAGVSGTGATMGRPTCAVLPAAINSDRTASSFGCVGNRVYTGADENDAYFAIPGAHLSAVEQQLTTILRANEALEDFHRARAAAI